MRTKKPFLIALFLCTWTIVSYYLLIRQTDSGNGNNRGGINGNVDGRHQRDSIHRQLDRLESNIEEENVIHDQLVKKLIEIVRLKDHKNEPAIAAKVMPAKNITTKHSNGIDTILGEAKPIPNGIDTIDAPNVIDNEIDKAFNADTESTDIDAPIINRLKELNQRTHNFKGPIIPVIVFACNRISVRNCLDDLVQYRPSAEQFPIIVSQVSYWIEFRKNKGNKKTAITIDDNQFSAKEQNEKQLKCRKFGCGRMLANFHKSYIFKRKPHAIHLPINDNKAYKRFYWTHVLCDATVNIIAISNWNTLFALWYFVYTRARSLSKRTQFSCANTFPQV